MRRFVPFLIVLVGLGALAVDVLRLPYPFGEGVIETQLGLDLQGGVRGEYRALPAPDRPISREDMETIRGIIEQRINQYGVAEPIVQLQGTDRVIVELPGSADQAQVTQLRRTIGQTGRLEFVPVPPDRTDVSEGSPIPPGLTPLFGGEELSVARPGFEETGRPAVDFELRERGAQLFSEWTSQNVGRQFAIVLDGTVVSAPVVRTPITGGRGQISGAFTLSEVNRLVAVLRYGALPLDLEEVQIAQISPSLGLDFLRQSLLAGSIGIVLVFLFMLIHYRLPGVIACVALIYYGIVVLAIFRLVPVTLTLAGVAAFVLSVGMAVDANILIFERTKEELRAGKTLFAAIEAGFNRAWNSIFDSNVSSIITAAVLYYFGSSVIRGFALVLIIGVLISMFTAITLSREMLRWVVRQPWARRASFFGVNEDEFTIAVAPRTRSREARARV
ncbi:MAG: protein translocase subunit SecD [Chloroflexota bacterium]|nr:protein translocase subunit SecD [Chloroflexota bacterium]